MRARDPLVCAALMLGLASCGGGSSAAPPDPTAGTISGSVHGTTWSKLSNAYWIGKNLPGGAAVTLFLFEASVACTDIVNLNWDKTATGARQILEIAFLEEKTGAFTVMTDVFPNYLFNNYNPDAFGGTATITAINPGVNLTGTFDFDFLGDKLMGTFDAKFCAGGVEP
jgi:hypothetical protein